jgi:uncharacterized protein YjdB
MAFSGYLLKIGSQEIPLKSIKLGSYNVTPDQRIDNASERDATGVLHRAVVEHQATKIEFNTPIMNNTDMAALNKIIHDGYTNELERKVSVTYYNPDTDDYKTGDFYVPDTQFVMSHIEGNTIWYDSVRFAFIEY